MGKGEIKPRRFNRLIKRIFTAVAVEILHIMLLSYSIIMSHYNINIILEFIYGTSFVISRFFQY